MFKDVDFPRTNQGLWEVWTLRWDSYKTKTECDAEQVLKEIREEEHPH